MRDNFDFDKMSENEFAEMLLDPLLWFIRMINDVPKEEVLAKADKARESFRSKYPEEFHNSGLESMFTMYSAGFTDALEMLRKIEIPAEETDHESL